MVYQYLLKEIELAAKKRPKNLKVLAEVLAYERYGMERPALSEAAYFRAKKALRDMNLLAPTPVRTLPPLLLNRELPPKTVEIAHLVTYLTKFGMDESVPPYGKTKGEIIKMAQEKLTRELDLAQDIVYGIQERLAWLSMFTLDFSYWVNTKGNLNPPASLSVVE